MSHACRRAFRFITKWILKWYYYSSLFIGLMPFKLNFNTGRGKKTNYHTIYTLILNLLTLTMIPLIYNLKIANFVKTTEINLNQKVFIGLSAVRTCALLATLILNWLNRDQILSILEDFGILRQRFRSLANVVAQDDEEIYESKIIIPKFLIGSYVAISSLSSMLLAMWNQFDLLLGFAFFSTTILLAILDVIITHFFFAAVNVNLYCSMLHKELMEILQVLEFEPTRNSHRSHASYQHHQELSNRLDELNILHHNLQNIDIRFTRLYQWQFLANIITWCLNDIAMAYLVYSWFIPDDAKTLTRFDNTHFWELFLMLSGACAYYTELGLLIRQLVKMLYCFQLNVDYIRQIIILPQLHKCLEKSVRMKM